jgi:hypothetical protein
VPCASASSIRYGLLATVLTFAVAAFGLWYQRLPGALSRGSGRLLGPPIGAVWAFTLT